MINHPWVLLLLTFMQHQLPFSSVAAHEHGQEQGQEHGQRRQEQHDQHERYPQQSAPGMLRGGAAATLIQGAGGGDASEPWLGNPDAVGWFAHEGRQLEAAQPMRQLQQSASRSPGSSVGSCEELDPVSPRERRTTTREHGLLHASLVSVMISPSPLLHGFMLNVSPLCLKSLRTSYYVEMYAAAFSEDRSCFRCSICVSSKPDRIDRGPPRQRHSSGSLFLPASRFVSPRGEEMLVP